MGNVASFSVVFQFEHFNGFFDFFVAFPSKHSSYFATFFCYPSICTFQRFFYFFCSPSFCVFEGLRDILCCTSIRILGAVQIFLLSFHLSLPATLRHFCCPSIRAFELLHDFHPTHTIFLHSQTSNPALTTPFLPKNHKTLTNSKQSFPQLS